MVSCLPALQGLGTWLFPLGTVSSDLQWGLQPGAQDLRVLLALVFNPGVSEIDSPMPSGCPPKEMAGEILGNSHYQRNRSPCLQT